MIHHVVDCIIIGAGAAGMMCGIEAGKRGRRVLILDKTNKVGKKILMSGGGRCNFTNTNTSPSAFISHNPHFCKSALSRYTPWDFIAMVERHKVPYFEKKLGQLFCEDKSARIVEMLTNECRMYHVEINLNQNITSITKTADGFVVIANNQHYRCQSLVIASGGLSIPTLGSSPFGYQIAQQFGLKVYPTRAGLVPLTLHVEDKHCYADLSGVSIDALVSCNSHAFHEHILFTHRGLSGPAILQISSFWQPGDEIKIKLLPQIDLQTELLQIRQAKPDSHLRTILADYIAKSILDVFYDADTLRKPLKQLTLSQITQVVSRLDFCIKPNGTEGYRTAEVTLGGVDCNQISSKTFESKDVAGLYFIGEVLDVTGWLGGYNFQWAWSSGWAAGQEV